MSRELITISLSDLDVDDYAVRDASNTPADDDLIASVRRDGVLQPILVERRGDRYVVLAGHRRAHAAKMCGLAEIPAQVVESTEGVGWRAAIAENMFRRDLSPLEEAAAIKDCIDGGEYDVDGVAAALGRTRAWVDGRLELLDWPADCQQVIHHSRLAVGAVRHLAQIDDDVHRRLLIDYAIDNGASARTCAAWLQAWRAGQPLRSPDDVVVDAAEDRPAPIVPYTPCVICSRQCKMAELSYLPVCHECGGVVLEIAGQLRAGGEGVNREGGSVQ